MNHLLIPKTSWILSLGLLLASVLYGSTADADEGNPIAIRYWGKTSISIETHWNFEIAINPTEESKSAGLVVRTQSHSLDRAGVSENAFVYDSTGIDATQPIATHVLDRWPNQNEASWGVLNPQTRISANAVRVTSIAEKGKAVLLQVDGIQILVGDGLDLDSLTTMQLESLVGLDVLILSCSALNKAQVGAWIERVKPHIFIPIQSDTIKTAAYFEWLKQGFGDKVEPKKIEGNTHALRAEKRTDGQKTQLVLMDANPWRMPDELAELFARKETASKDSQAVFAKLTIQQLNFKPSNGTHTARWNTEHMMGRELGFFSQIYAQQDPNVPAFDLNPKQMPPDYVAAHLDWTGAEEARQTERVCRFSRRFAYLLKDLPMEKKAPGSFWTPKSLLLQMEEHYSEHTANVIKKFELPDWPKNNEPISLNVWPDLAPDETSRETGTLLPVKPGEAKPIDRVSGVRRPTLDVYPAKNNPNGTAVLILPGGGFTYVVPNLEGSEAAPWLNELGVTVFVLRYRTKESAIVGEPLWQRPLQDTQRAMRLIRDQARNWQIQTDRIGILGFSAGGQVASIAHSKADVSAYAAIDAIDKQSCKPDFSLLIYPWQLLDPKSSELIEPVHITEQSAPSFIVHTHDDASSSIGAVKLYIALKQSKVPAELHVYQNGGHGYGIRDRPDSVISSWPARATDWLRLRRLLDPKK